MWRALILVVVLCCNAVVCVPNRAEASIEEDQMEQDGEAEEATPGSTGSAAAPASSPAAAPASASGPSGFTSVLTGTTAAPAAPLSGTVSAAAVEQHPGYKMFMWKATKGDQVVYLLGTIHVAKANFYPLPKEMEQAFQESKALYLECSMTGNAKLAKLQEDKTMYVKGDCLSKHLSPETKKVFKDYLNWAGESMDMYEQLQPAFAGACIATSSLRRAGYKPELGIDEHFYEQAKRLKKPVIGLEPMEMHIAGASAIEAGKSGKQLDKELGSMFADMKECQGRLDEILRLWREADLVKFDSRDLDENKTNAESRAEYKRIVFDRNVTMVDSLLRQMKGPGPHFVAVGGAHMGTDKGMLALMEQKGFKVEQMRSKPAPVGPTTSGKLSRLSFPDGEFSILLPGKPEMAYKDHSNLRSVHYKCVELPFGLYDVCYINCPGNLSHKPANMIMDLLCAIYIKSFNAKETSHYIWNVPGGVGRELILSGIGKDSDGAKELARHGIEASARLRMAVIGSHFYVISAIGSKPWLKSKATEEYMASFKYTPRYSEDGYGSNYARPAGGSYSSSGSGRRIDKSDIDAIERRNREDAQRREDNATRDRNAAAARHERSKLGSPGY
ncbi:MAG: TraB/GumN family protein [Candidatus Obscuribacterales bacterium]|nr:TraB/GumN family protein [Candidatus Obscuribacterales bacterium]